MATRKVTITSWKQLGEFIFSLPENTTQPIGVAEIEELSPGIDRLKLTVDMIKRSQDAPPPDEQEEDIPF